MGFGEASTFWKEEVRWLEWIRFRLSGLAINTLSATIDFSKIIEYQMTFGGYPLADTNYEKDIRALHRQYLP